MFNYKQQETMIKLLEIFVLIAATFTIAAGDDATANDIEYPCGKEASMACVTKYIAKSGQCSEITSRNPKLTEEVNFPIYVPSVNLTLILKNYDVYNLNGTVRNFYVNKKTGNLVMSAYYENILANNADIVFAISQRGKEYKVFVEKGLIRTGAVIFTGIIPVHKYKGVNAEALKEARYFAYLLDDKTTAAFGPKFSDSEDPIVSAVYQQFGSRILIGVKEDFRTTASLFFLTWLQNSVSDCGISPDFKENYDTKALLNMVDIDTNDDTSFTKHCNNGDDMKTCVRNYFDENSECSVVKDADDKPVFRESFKLYVPINNVTAFPADSQITGLDGTIEEFYTNEQTGNLVMAVNFAGIRRESPSTPFYVFDSDKEPSYHIEAINDTFPVVLTAIIDKELTCESLEKAMVSAYIPAPNVVFRSCTINKGGSEDPEVDNIVDAVEEYTTIIADEELSTEAYSFFIAFFQKYICDCKLSLSSKH